MLEQMQANTGTTTLQGADEIPFNAEIAFTNRKGVYKRGIEKRQRTLFEKIRFLKPFLQEDEEVLLVTTGCSPFSTIEVFLTSWLMVMWMKRSLFVFTNKRIFHIPTKFNYTYRRSIAQILYADCRKLYLRFGNLVAKYKNNQTETFYYLGGKERRKIKSLLKQISLQGRESRSLRRIHLCPDCAGELVQGRYTCPDCGRQFKNEHDMRRISIMYPGGGYFYTGHWWLGICDSVVETMLAAFLVTSIIDAVRGVQEAWAAIIPLTIIFIIEKLLTIYHSNHFIKEYIPKQQV